MKNQGVSSAPPSQTTRSSDRDDRLPDAVMALVESQRQSHQRVEAGARMHANLVNALTEHARRDRTKRVRMGPPTLPVARGIVLTE